MSAFIVEDSCINKIITFFNHNRDLCWVFHNRGYDPGQTEDLDRLASDLYLMNCDAVDQRYSKGTTAGDTAAEPAFEFKFDHAADSVAIYKALSCLIYQCSEGNVPERPLYGLLERMQRALAHKIISGLPGYNAAAWGR